MVVQKEWETTVAVCVVVLAGTIVAVCVMVVLAGLPACHSSLCGGGHGVLRCVVLWGCSLPARQALRSKLDHALPDSSICICFQILFIQISPGFVSHSVPFLTSQLNLDSVPCNQALWHVLCFSSVKTSHYRDKRQFWSVSSLFPPLTADSGTYGVSVNFQ